jgi:hypothetical protein
MDIRSGMHWTNVSRKLQTGLVTNTPIQTVHETLNKVRHELRERREARAALRALERELGSYTTSREVDDLLGVIKAEASPEAQRIREILLNNLHGRTELFRVG